MNRSIILTGCFGLLLTGCAGMNVFPVSDGLLSDKKNSHVHDAKANGIRFYQPAHFLLAYSDGPGSVKTEIIVLPDTTKKMAAKPYTFLSKNKVTLTFTDGILTRSEQEADATAVPSAILAAIKEAAQVALTVLNDGSGPAQPKMLDAPRLYKISIKGNSVTLTGDDSNDKIELPLSI